MIRAVSAILLAIAFAAGFGYAVTKTAGLNPHARDMILAGAAVFLASGFSLIPLLLTRGADQATVSQTGLAVTVIHMLLTAALGMGASAALHPSKAFLYWLLLFYWVCLAIVSVISVKVIRSAPVTVK